MHFLPDYPTCNSHLCNTILRLARQLLLRPLCLCLISRTYRVYVDIPYFLFSCWRRQEINKDGRSRYGNVPVIIVNFNITSIW